MSAERIIGVDFGTSTSVIRVKRYENGEPIGEILETKGVVFGSNGAMVPTLVMKKKDDESVTYYGYEAQKRRKDFTNFHSFKVDLESSDPEKRAQARRLTEEFFGFMAKQYRDQSEGGHLGNSDDKVRTIISYPVKWSDETKQFMIETAKEAGFPNVSGMDEAQAAIKAVTVMNTDHLRNHGLLKNGVAANILLIDMGAGTTDLVLCRYTPGSAEAAKILNTWPKSGDILFGGKEIDSLLQNFFRDKMDEEDVRDVLSRVGTDKFKSWKEETVSPALRNNDSVSDFEVLDNCIEMMGIDMEEYCLDRAGFENCLKDYLKQLPVLINGCIEHAGISGKNVDLVIVTGGHSQWYFVKEMLAGKMPQFGQVDLAKIKEEPARIISIARPQETVALGLAYHDITVDMSDEAKREEEDRKAKEGFQMASQTAEEWYEDDDEIQEEESQQISQMAEEWYEGDDEIQEEEFQMASQTAEEQYTPESEFELGNIGEDYFIRKYIGKRSVVSIPPVIRGRKVVAIGQRAFGKNGYTSFLSTIKTVIIPDTVRRIEASAFFLCGKLETVIAHKDIEFIGAYAFWECKKLQTMDFGMGNCGNKVVKFPKNLKEIGSNAFLAARKGGFENGCVLREVTLSRNTKVKNPLGSRTFSPKHCAIFYYD